MRKLRDVSENDLTDLRSALADLRTVRARLHRAGARQSHRYVARAIKSVAGAVNHAHRCHSEHVRQATANGVSVDRLHHVELHSAKPVPGTRLFFAIASDGHAVLHDNTRFYGHANTWHTTKRGQCFRASVFGFDHSFAKRHAIRGTKEAAHSALFAMARRAFGRPITVRDLQQTVNETQRKLHKQ